jgi:hypothetical protein
MASDALYDSKLGSPLTANKWQRHVSLVFAAVHVIWFCAAAATLGHHPHSGISFLPDGSPSVTLFAGRPFHFEYESPILKILLWADVPAFLLAGVPEYCCGSWMQRYWSVQARSYLDAGLLLCLGSLQWAIIGYVFAARWMRRSGLSQQDSESAD